MKKIIKSKRFISAISILVVVIICVIGLIGVKYYKDIKTVESFLVDTLQIQDQLTIDEIMNKAKEDISTYADRVDAVMNPQGVTEDVEATPANHDVVDENNPVATIVIKDYGTLTYELFPEEAPETVNNFISLANSGFYDGTTCHRVVQDFMVQCGDPDGTGSGGPGYSIPGEMSNNDGPSTLTHEPGALAMARSSSYDSAGSQFYTVTNEASSLDGEYTVFGYLLTGEEVLTEINNVDTTCETSECSTPIEPIVIESVTVDTKGVTYAEPTKL